MTEDRETNLRKLVNASGFLFQLGAEHHIRQSRAKHGWDVILREHPWNDSVTGDEGYIDLVLGKGITRIILECKRSQDATWVFLVSNGQPEEIQRVRGQWVERKVGEEIRAGCYEWTIDPKSPEAGFCVVRGTGETDRPMLERLSDLILKSLDCLAEEELQIANPKTIFRRIYLPAIVTTAKLEICYFNPEDVSLKDGKISGGVFKSVPLVRFRKSLTTSLTPNIQPQNLTEAGQDKERTVIIIDGSELTTALRQIQILKSEFEAFPWKAD